MEKQIHITVSIFIQHNNNNKFIIKNEKKNHFQILNH